MDQYSVISKENGEKDMGKKKEKKTRKRIKTPTGNITNWQDPQSIVETVKGSMSYYDWCCEEAESQTKRGWLAKVQMILISRNRSRVAVVHN